MVISFTAPFVAVPKARPRFTRKGFAYTPKKTADYERQIATLARSAMAKAGAERIDGKPFSVTATFYYVPPESWTKKRKQEVLDRIAVPKMTKPDTDNCMKAVMDAMNGVVYADDAGAAAISAEKKYSYEFGDTVQVMVRTFDD